MKTRTKWIAGIEAVVITVPCALYLLVNFYWWLFDGNVLNGDKVFGAGMVFLVGVILEVATCGFSEYEGI